MTSARPLIFSPTVRSEVTDPSVGPAEQSCVEGTEQSGGSAQPRPPRRSLICCCVINGSGTRRVKTTFHLMTSWVRNSGEFNRTVFLPHVVRREVSQWWSAGRGLIWKVQHGPTHVFRALVGLCRTEDGRMFLWPLQLGGKSQGSRLLTWWLKENGVD